jgi:hypothetical protein
VTTTGRTPSQRPDTWPRSERQALRGALRKQAQAIVLDRRSAEVSEEYARLCRDMGIEPDED